MTKETLAARLNGREYGSEITALEEVQAKAAGLLVIYGYSDDNLELRGAIHDEIGCCGGGDIYLHADGVLDVAAADGCFRCERRMVETKKLCVLVGLLWNKEPGYSWTYATEVPHATFEILEDGKPFCRGLVISTNDLPKVDV